MPSSAARLCKIASAETRSPIGDLTALVTVPASPLVQEQTAAGRRRLLRRRLQTAEAPSRLPAEVQPRHDLLAQVTTLGVAHRVFETGFLGQIPGIEIDPEPRYPLLHPDDLDGIVVYLRKPSGCFVPEDLAGLRLSLKATPKASPREHRSGRRPPPESLVPARPFRGGATEMWAPEGCPAQVPAIVAVMGPARVRASRSVRNLDLDPIHHDVLLDMGCQRGDIRGWQLEPQTMLRSPNHHIGEDVTLDVGEEAANSLARPDSP